MNRQEKARYEQYLKLRERGKLLSPAGLKMICEAHEYDPEKIGRHFLEVLARYSEDDFKFGV